MIIKKLNVFSFEDMKIKTIGNPASVCLIDNFENINMSEIAAMEKTPICVFCKKNKDKDNFYIRGFFPNGKEINFCGHGTIAAAKIIRDYYNINVDKSIKFIFGNFNSKNIGILSDDFFELNLNITNIEKVYLNKMILGLILKSFNITSKNILNFFYCKLLNDYVLQINSSEILRSINIDNKNFNELNDLLKFRGFSITAKSDISGFDYENRIFSINLENYEDIVCGSSACYLTSLWSKKLDKKDLTALFPYKNSKEYYGGVEFISIKDDFNFSLGGFVK